MIVDEELGLKESDREVRESAHWESRVASAVLEVAACSKRHQILFGMALSRCTESISEPKESSKKHFLVA
jgi:hypothetical protein